MFAALFIVACGGSTHSPSEIPALNGADATQPADKEVGLAGPGSGGDGGGGPLDGQEPTPWGYGDEAGPLDPQSLVDFEQTGINPWGPVVETLCVPQPGGGSITVNRLLSPDPFTAWYQLENGGLLETNKDLSQGIEAILSDPGPPWTQWTDPWGDEWNILQGEINIDFIETAGQAEIETFIADNDLYVVFSWFEPKHDGNPGNEMAWFEFEYPEETFSTFQEAYDYFSVQPLVLWAEPVVPDFYGTDYNPYPYAPDDDRYTGNQVRPVNIYGVDATRDVKYGPSNLTRYGTWFSHQGVAVIDDGVLRSHEDFKIWGFPWFFKKITWVGTDVISGTRYTDIYRGEPDPLPIDLHRGSRPSHGTSVAGVISASTNNDLYNPSSGVAGLAPSAYIVPIRMAGTWCASDGNMKFGHNAQRLAIKALRLDYGHGKWKRGPYLTDEKIRVVNMSFGGKKDRHPRGVKWQINQDLKHNDRLYVASAGNEHSHLRRYPAAYDNVLGVSGLITNAPGTWWDDYYGGYGSNYFSDPDTYPVSGIFDFREHIDDPYPFDYWSWYGRSTSIPGTKWWAGSYDHFNGTSAAAPQVSALAHALYDRADWRLWWMVRNRIVIKRDDSKARGQLAGLADYHAALDGWW